MIYWIQEATQAGAQGAVPAWPGAILSGGLVGAVVGLVGVLVGQYLTQRRHSQTLRQTAELEAQRAHEAALQKYFEQMRETLTDPKRPLRRSTMGDNLSTVARAQTLAVLQGLDPDRKRILIQFLYEANLIKANKPVISLASANLSGANLSWADLSLANLSGADLYEAILQRAYLEGANLSWANLSGANLQMADLEGAKLEGTNLSGANLIFANLSGANLYRAILEGANLSGADLYRANLEGTQNLSKEQIQQANGNENTQLPDHIQRPDHWLNADKE